MIQSQEEIRSTLLAARDIASSRLSISTYLVLIGVALEVPEVIHDISEALCRFRLTGRPKKWIKIVSAIGLVLVIGGVAGELKYELASSTDSKSIEAIDRSAGLEQERSLTQAKSDFSGKQSEMANSLEGEKQKTSRFQIEADAKEKSLNDELSATAKLLDKTKSDLINRAVCSAPRILTGDSFIDGKVRFPGDTLMQFSGSKAIVEYLPYDAESRRAAMSIYDTLHGIMWDVSPPRAVDEIRDGVEVQSYQGPFTPTRANIDRFIAADGAIRSARRVAEAFVGFLHSFNWQAHLNFPYNTNGTGMLRDDAVIPPGAIRIQVGLYPPVSYVSPPAAAEASRRMAEISKESEEKWGQRLRDRTAKLPLQVRPDVEAMIAARKNKAITDNGPCQGMVQ